MSYSRGYGGDSFCFGIFKNHNTTSTVDPELKNPQISQQMDPLSGVDSVRSILERNTKKYLRRLPAEHFSDARKAVFDG